MIDSESVGGSVSDRSYTSISVGFDASDAALDDNEDECVSIGAVTPNSIIQWMN